MKNMNRQVKFRIWDENKKVMAPVRMESIRRSEELDYSFTDGEIDHGDYLSLESNTRDFEPDNIVLMQFTGLLDRNSKEIYEGDILRDEKEQLGVVFWYGASFRIEWQMRSYDGSRPVMEIDNCFSYSIVIGNYFENPELLKDTK